MSKIKEYSKIIDGKKYFDFDTYFKECLPPNLPSKKSVNEKGLLVQPVKPKN